MGEMLEFNRRGLDRFGEHVHAVKEDQWDASTPCSDWSVRALVNHLVNEQLWVPPLLSGATIADVGDRFDGDVLGDDPVAAWDSASSGARQAWDEPGVTERTVHLSYGDVPAQ